MVISSVLLSLTLSLFRDNGLFLEKFHPRILYFWLDRSEDRLEQGQWLDSITEILSALRIQIYQAENEFQH